MPKALYATIADYREYAIARGGTLTNTDGSELSDNEIQVLLTKSQDYVDLVFTYKGEAVFDNSEFPRAGLDRYDDTTIPQAVTTATLYVASCFADGLLFVEGSRAEAQIKREVIAGNKIEIEYATNYKNENTTQGYTVLEAPLLILQRAGLISNLGSTFNLFGMRG